MPGKRGLGCWSVRLGRGGAKKKTRLGESLHRGVTKGETKRSAPASAAHPSCGTAATRFLRAGGEITGVWRRLEFLADAVRYTNPAVSQFAHGLGMANKSEHS